MSTPFDRALSLFLIAAVLVFFWTHTDHYAETVAALLELLS